MSDERVEEPYLGTARETRKVLDKYDFVFRKKYGQNFLVDPHVIQKIVRAAELTKEDFVLEIGPGIGTLTQYLAYHAGRVQVVEIDSELIPILEDTLQAYDNVKIRQADILKVDIPQLVQQENAGRKIKVVANLPYYITTPIVMGLFEQHVPLDSVTIMVQKEVAQRMQAAPGTKEYGALSVAVQYYAEANIAAYVPQNCFIPRPKVGSAVIVLKRFREPPVRVKDEALLFRVVRASFAQRRKTLRNALYNAPALPGSREAILTALEIAGIAPNVRGETLSLQQFAVLADAFSEIEAGEAR